MPAKGLQRRSSLNNVYPLATVAPIYIDSASNITKIIPTGSGSTELDVVTGVNYKALAADLAITSNATLASITGMSWNVVAAATYFFRMIVPLITQTSNGGSQLAFKLTTATLASINLRVWSSTDTDNTGAISTNFTTTTDQSTWFNQKAVVYTYAAVEGTFITTLGGSIAVQAAQNTSHIDTTTIAKGATALLVRVA